MVEYYKTSKGYYYKKLNNGTSMRVSKIHFGKQSNNQLVISNSTYGDILSKYMTIDSKIITSYLDFLMKKITTDDNTLSNKMLLNDNTNLYSIYNQYFWLIYESFNALSGQYNIIQDNTSRKIVEYKVFTNSKYTNPTIIGAGTYGYVVKYKNKSSTVVKHIKAKGHGGRNTLRGNNDILLELFIHMILLSNDSPIIQQCIPKIINIFRFNTTTSHYICAEITALTNTFHKSTDLQDTAILSLFLQIVVILIELQKLFGFIHGDLSSHNIMYRSVNKKDIKTKINGIEYLVFGDYKIRNYGYIINLIDFGFSCINKDGALLSVLGQNIYSLHGADLCIDKHNKQVPPDKRYKNQCNNKSQDIIMLITYSCLYSKLGILNTLLTSYINKYGTKYLKDFIKNKLDKCEYAHFVAIKKELPHFIPTNFLQKFYNTTNDSHKLLILPS
jgi:hypothetical protein